MKEINLTTKKGDSFTAKVDCESKKTITFVKIIFKGNEYDYKVKKSAKALLLVITECARKSGVQF